MANKVFVLYNEKNHQLISQTFLASKTSPQTVLKHLKWNQFQPSHSSFWWALSSSRLILNMMAVDLTDVTILIRMDKLMDVDQTDVEQTDNSLKSTFNLFKDLFHQTPIVSHKLYWKVSILQLFFLCLKHNTELLLEMHVVDLTVVRHINCDMQKRRLWYKFRNKDLKI